MNTYIVGAVLAVFLSLVGVRWWWKKKAQADASALFSDSFCMPASATNKLESTDDAVSGSQAHVIHRLCPHNNVVQGFQVERKDSLDDHLDALTRKLAEKVGEVHVQDEGRLRLSKYKIREKQQEIDNLHAIDHDLKAQYRDIIDNLRKDLSTNELECRKLQDQIEWVSRRRAELKEDVQLGQRLYGQLSANLSDMHDRLDHSKVTDKPLHCSRCLRHRKEPVLPHVTPVGSIVIKHSPKDTPESVSYVLQN